MNARHRLRTPPVSSTSSTVSSPFDDLPTDPAAAPAAAPVTPWASVAPTGSPVAIGPRSAAGSALSSLDVFTPTFDELMYGPSAARYAPDTTQRLPAYGGVLGQHPRAPESNYPTLDTDATEPLNMQSEIVPDDDVLDDTFSAAMARTRARPATRNEGQITSEVLEWLNSQPRTFARKVHQAAMSGGGEPDIDACVDGRSVKIEMKRPGETPTDRQLNRLKRWQRAGAVVGWATSLDEVRALVGRVPDVRWRNPLTGPGAP